MQSGAVEHPNRAHASVERDRTLTGCVVIISFHLRDFFCFQSGYSIRCYLASFRYLCTLPDTVNADTASALFCRVGKWNERLTCKSDEDHLEYQEGRQELSTNTGSVPTCACRR